VSTEKTLDLDEVRDRNFGIYFLVVVHVLYAETKQAEKVALVCIPDG
jgi:hypothetical protein